MRFTNFKRCAFVIAVIVLASCAAALADNQPMLNATYTVGNVDLGPASVSVTFTFTLTNQGAGEVKAEQITLSDAMKTQTFATFDGGTIASGESLTRTQNVTVPRALAKSLKDGEPAALFVTTRTENGTMRSYIAAYFQPPAKEKKKQG